MIVDQRDSGWSCELIAVPYDHAAMARLAKLRGASDWASALSTGRLHRTDR